MRRALLILAIGLLTLAARAQPAGPDRPDRISDVQLYQRIVARLQAGDGYYAAVGDTLRQNHYATVEVFNWRTPLLMSALAVVPLPVMQGVLHAAAAAFWCLGLVGFARRRDRVAFAAFLVLGGGCVLGIAPPNLLWFGEAWAGIALGLACVGYLNGWPRAAAVCGVLALALRELAAPFALLCAGLAWWQGRRDEWRIWRIGLTLYGLLYGLHLWAVKAHGLPADQAHPHSWIALGGWRFVIDTIRWNGWLHDAPIAWIAVVAMGLTAGMLSARIPRQVRLGAAAYAIGFCLAGQPFDTYWGLLVAPPWALSISAGWSDLYARSYRAIQHRITMKQTSSAISTVES